MRRPKKILEQAALLENGVLKKTVSLSAELDKRPRERKKFETGDVFFRAVFWSDREKPESIRFRVETTISGVSSDVLSLFANWKSAAAQFAY